MTPPGEARAPEWLEECLVWGQVNVHEQDPATLDVGWWAGYWRDCKLQGITLNVGGPVAFYPTDIPHHHRSGFLGDGDLLGDMVKAAKDLGLRVMGRLDPSYMNPELFEAHPDWCTRRPDGTPLTWQALNATFFGEDVTGTDTSYVPCSQTPYLDEYLFSIVTEVLTRYELDGIWTNGWPPGPAMGRTLCHCQHCIAAWASAHPDRERPSDIDPASDAWWEFHDHASTRLEAVQRRLRDHVHSVRPEAVFISSAITHAGTPLRWGRWIENVDALGIDAQMRPSLGVEPARAPALWGVGLQSELSRAVSRGKQVLRFVATYMADQPVSRHGARPPMETRLQMAQALAHGERPKWHTLGGTSFDRRWMPAVRELDQWLADHQRWLLDRTPLSDIAMLWSPRSVQLETWQQDPGPSHRDAIVGWYAALTRARVPFEVVHEDDLDGWERFRVLVLPSGFVASDSVLEALELFTAQGGAIVSCSTALNRDDHGRSRSPERIEVLSGVRPTGELIGPLRHSCIALDGDARLFSDLGDTDVIAGGRWVAPFDTGTSRAEGSWVPEYPLSPTHDVVMPPARTDVSIAAVSTGAGGGTRVALAADLDAAHGRYEDPDHQRVLVNAVKAALGASPMTVEVSGPGVVDVRPWQHAQGMSVFLVNLDNVMAQGVMVREVRPLGPLSVTVRVPAGSTVTEVRLLRHDQECTWTQTSDTVSVSVPKIEDFELIAISLGSE